MLILLSVSALMACATYIPLTPMQSDADRIANKFPGITLADLSEGKTLYEQNCVKCHNLKTPFKVSEEEVINIMPKMAHKAKIDSKTQDLILKYILTMKTASKR